MRNAEVARLLYTIADILEIQEVPFKPVAYRRAGRSIEELPEDIEDVFRRGDLEKIPGIGKNIAEKIEEYLQSGKLRYLEKLKKEAPFDIEGMSEIEGIGPKTAKKLYDSLKVRTVSDLEKAARAHRISSLEGFGEASEQRILDSIEAMKRRGDRIPLGKIAPAAQELRRRILAVAGVSNAEIVGSYRRRLETVGDLDILAVSSSPEKVMDFFCSMRDVERVLAKGSTRSAVELTGGLHVDLRAIESESFGSAMQYFTGSKEHNVATRRIAVSKGMKLSEYGLFKGETQVAGRTEKGIYAALGLAYVPPELRENSGEVQAALSGKLPKLVELRDIKGDLHVHTNWSEGKNSLEEMAMKGKSLGHEYMLICDHGGNLPVANSLDERRISRQGKEIDALNKLGAKNGWPFLLKGSEVNITKDGVDVADSTLRELDIVVAAIHSGFRNSRKKIMERLFCAMENEHVDIIAHPTGRIIGRREPYEVDIPELLDKAKETGTILEINSQPDRLDLKDVHARKAKDKIKLSISTDAHADSQMDYLWLGVATARRGWCRKKDIINTIGLRGLGKVFDL
ncbi:MAG: DNA polymerase/3'-5' exonuclease PolX [Candidatus Micrarchaeota archaeon]